MTRRNPPPMPRVEVVSGRIGPVSGTICGFILAVATPLLADVVDGFQPWFPLAFAAAVVAAVAAGRRKRKILARTAWFTGACVTVPAVWATVTIVYGWSPAGVFVLFVFAVFAGVLASIFSTPPADVAAIVAAEQAQEEQAKRDPQEVEIEELLREFLHTKRPPAVIKEYEWPQGTGNTWRLIGQRGTRFNYRHVTDIQQDLAAAMQLPPGCPINAVPGKTHQGEALMHVSRVNDMHLDIAFPMDLRMRSVREDFQIGLFLDKSPTNINLFQDSTLVNGQKGAGKSVILQSVVANSLMFHDNLTGIVDLNGGRLFGPWMMLYAAGLVDKPPLAFVAPTARTALELATYLVALAKKRSAIYQQMMALHNVEVLPVGNGRDVCSLCHQIHPPAIQIIVDEGGEMMGDDATPEAMEAAQLFREVVRIARAMAINVIISTQRGTQDYLPAQVKKAISQMITLRVFDESELAWLFGWTKGLSPDDLADYPGKGYIQRRGGAVQMFKAQRLMPAQMGEIARFVSTQEQAQLEPPAVALGGRWLSGFWDHPDIAAYVDQLRVGSGDGGGQPLGPGAGLVGAGAGVAPPDFMAGRESISVSGVSALAEAMRTLPPPPAEVEMTPEQVRAARREQIKNMSGDDMALALHNLDLELDGVLADETADTGNDTTTAGDGVASSDAGEAARLETTKAARYEFVVKTVVAAGEDGIKTEEVVKRVIQAGLARNGDAGRKRVSETLGEALDAGRIAKKIGPDGQVVFAMWVGPGYAAR